MKEGDFNVTVWKKLMYLQKGVSHVQNGTNCQDSVLIFENEDCIVAALADGLGSLKYSEVAAQTATDTVCKCFAELNNPLEQFETKEDLAKHILDAVVMSIQEKTVEMGVPLNEMDCTLMFVYVLKSTNCAIIGRLGDSAVCVIADPKSIAINDGNKSANGTNAILDKDAVEHFEIQILDLDKNNVYGFVLSSDGLENELYMKGSDHVNKTAELYFNAWFTADDPVTVIVDRISKLTEIEGTPFDDDISVAVLSRANEAIILPADPKWLCTCGFRNHLQTTYCQQCHKDFSVLYQNIRFRDYGGKAEFFTEINKHPEEELRIIGMKTKSSVVKQEKPIAKSESLEIPQMKSSPKVIEASGISIPHNGSRTTQQGEKTKSVREQHSVEIESSTKKVASHEMDIDSPQKMQTKVTTAAGYTNPTVQMGEKRGNAETKKETVIPSKQDVNKKKGMIPSEENCGKKKQKNLPPPVGETENASRQVSGKHTAKIKKPRYNVEALKMIGILMAVTLVIGLIVGGIFVKNITSSKVRKLTNSVDELTEKISRYEAELAEKENQPAVLLPEDFSVLEDGSYYWGSVDDLKLPHGSGILKKDDKYYIGIFDHGKKDGEFSIIDSSGEHYIENYIGDELIADKEVDEDTPAEKEEQISNQSFSTVQYPQRYETQYVANLREIPGKENNLVIALKAGSTVYLVETTEKQADDLYWMHVKTEDGYEGWILTEALKRDY